MDEMKISMEDMRKVLDDRATLLALKAYVQNTEYLNDNVIRQILGVEIKDERN